MLISDAYISNVCGVSRACSAAPAVRLLIEIDNSSSMNGAALTLPGRYV